VSSSTDETCNWTGTPSPLCIYFIHSAKGHNTGMSEAKGKGADRCH